MILIQELILCITVIGRRMSGNEPAPSRCIKASDHATLKVNTENWLLMQSTYIFTCCFEKCCCCCNTWAVLLWSTCCMWRTSADLLKCWHSVLNTFFFPAFKQSLQIINTLALVALVSSQSNSFSHLSKTLPCLPLILIISAQIYTYSPECTTQASLREKSIQNGGCLCRCPGCTIVTGIWLCQIQYNNQNFLNFAIYSTFSLVLKQLNLTYLLRLM